jgi:hypothetical protein
VGEFYRFEEKANRLQKFVVEVDKKSKEVQRKIVKIFDYVPRDTDIGQSISMNLTTPNFG